MVYRFAQSLSPGGLLAIGQENADSHVPADDPHWDKSHTYVENYSEQSGLPAETINTLV